MVMQSQYRPVGTTFLPNCATFHGRPIALPYALSPGAGPLCLSRISFLAPKEETLSSKAIGDHSSDKLTL